MPSSSTGLLQLGWSGFPFGRSRSSLSSHEPFARGQFACVIVILRRTILSLGDVVGCTCVSIDVSSNMRTAVDVARRFQSVFTNSAINTHTVPTIRLTRPRSIRGPSPGFSLSHAKGYFGSKKRLNFPQVNSHTTPQTISTTGKKNAFNYPSAFVLLASNHT